MNSTGPDDVVGQRLRVPVGEVGRRPQSAVAHRLVAHERDRVGVGAERRTGQHQPPGRRVERLAHRLAPGHGVAGVVDLVQDHQRPEALHPDPQGQRVGRHARVGQRDPVEVLGRLPLADTELRVDGDADPVGRLGPLGLQVLGRRHDDDPVHHPLGQQVGGHGQGEGGLARPGRGDGEEVLLRGLEVGVQGGRLPGPQLGRRAPGGPIRKGRRQSRDREIGRVESGGRPGHRRECSRGIRPFGAPATPRRPTGGARGRRGESFRTGPMRSELAVAAQADHDHRGQQRPEGQGEVPGVVQRREDRPGQSHEEPRAQGVAHVQRGSVAALVGRRGEGHHGQAGAGRGQSHAEAREQPADPDQPEPEPGQQGRDETDRDAQRDRQRPVRDQPVPTDPQPGLGLQPGRGGPADRADGQHRPGHHQRHLPLLDQHQRQEGLGAEERARAAGHAPRSPPSGRAASAGSRAASAAAGDSPSPTTPATSRPTASRSSR